MTTVEQVAADDFDPDGSAGPAAAVRAVVASAAHEDAATPLDEAALLALRHGLGSSLLWTAGVEGVEGVGGIEGFAWRHDGALDLVVDPSARGRGTGAALAASATAEPGPLTAWSHGNHPAAAVLARRHGFDRVRDLWVMRRTLSDLPPEEHGDGIDVRTFVPGRDEDAFLTLNAQAFADHPEQGRLDRRGLEERMAEPWFDPNGFFLAERDGQLLGFHWTKVHDGPRAVGEVYVVGVSPHAQGLGLGRRLTAVGLQHLASRGLPQVLLYVESDNNAAVAVYQRLGFTHAPQDTHVQYRRR